jgi:hypothetical protein
VDQGTKQEEGPKEAGDEHGGIDDEEDEIRGTEHQAERALDGDRYD